MKEKVVCGNLYQPADSVRLATPLARFGKVVRTASKQGVASSSLARRAITFLLNRNELEKVAFTPGPLRKKQTVGVSENARTGRCVGFLEHFLRFCRVLRCVSANCHENVTPILALVLQNPATGVTDRVFIP